MRARMMGILGVAAVSVFGSAVLGESRAFAFDDEQPDWRSCMTNKCQPTAECWGSMVIRDGCTITCYTAGEDHELHQSGEATCKSVPTGEGL